MGRKQSPAHYHQMAQEIRSIAEAIADQDAREMMERVADEYERMAREAWDQRPANPSHDQPS